MEIEETTLQMEMTTQTISRDDLFDRMTSDKVKRVVLIDGKRKMDRYDMRKFIRSNDINLTSPRVGYVVFKLTGNLEGCDDE